MVQSKQDVTYIKVKDMYIKKEKINFFYFNQEDDTLFVGVDGNTLAIELDDQIDDIPQVLDVLDNLVKYKKIC